MIHDILAVAHSRRSRSSFGVNASTTSRDSNIPWGIGEHNIIYILGNSLQLLELRMIFGMTPHNVCADGVRGQGI